MNRLVGGAYHRFEPRWRVFRLETPSDHEISTGIQSNIIFAQGFLLFSSLKLTRKLLDWFGDVNQFGMARIDTGERFPSRLQWFTVGYKTSHIQ